MCTNGILSLVLEDASKLHTVYEYTPHRSVVSLEKAQKHEVV